MNFTPLKNCAGTYGDIEVYFDDDFLQLVVDGELVMFVDSDDAKRIIEILQKAAEL